MPAQHVHGGGCAGIKAAATALRHNIRLVASQQQNLTHITLSLCFAHVEFFGRLAYSSSHCSSHCLSVAVVVVLLWSFGLRSGAAARLRFCLEARLESCLICLATLRATESSSSDMICCILAGVGGNALSSALILHLLHAQNLP